MSKRQIIITSIILGILALVIIVFLFIQKGTADKIMIPFIAHQKPVVDPHLPNSIQLSDKLDEVEFDGLFNISANPSGIIYEDGLGELVRVDENSTVHIKLNTGKKWHSSYSVTVEDDEVIIKDSVAQRFSAEDLKYTLDRIKRLGSLSPDYILVNQAIPSMDFDGPNQEDIVKFNFRNDRIWTESDIKEVLSFKIIPRGAESRFNNGTGQYMSLPSSNKVSNYFKSPDATANISNIILVPFIDNSTFTTELRNNSINVLLETPFGSLSPVLDLEEDFFFKSKLSTTFFAILFNTDRLSRLERREIRKIFDNNEILNRFFKVGSPQQREIVDYLGNKNNFIEYLNYSIFPSSSYYVEEGIVVPVKEESAPDFSVIPDTLRFRSCLNFGYREELSEIIQILNNSKLPGKTINVTAVGNEEIKNGNYDALLLAFTGYRSNFLFDLYDIFLREPDLENYKINLITSSTPDGNRIADPASFSGDNNFFRLNSKRNNEDNESVKTLLSYIHNFMSTKEIGDKQAYAERIDRLENELALGIWLFSLPSLSYFSTQFDSTSIVLYGSASQLSTIENWKEKRD